METHVNYLRVGSFVIGGFLAMIAFILWLNKFGFGENVQTYHIYFTGAVSGLKSGNAVQYRGVPIGKVSKIEIDPKNVERIMVSVKIDKKVLIKEDMIASLETYGLTGISYIQINGGTAAAKNINTSNGIPVIKSKSSLLEQVSGTLPDILKKMDGLVSDIRSMFSDENREAFSQVLKNISEITAYFKPKEGDKSKDTFLFELTQAIANLNTVLREFSLLINDNKTGLREFTTTGLNSFTRFMTEGRESLAAIRRVSESLERSPSRFFYNDPKEGVPVR
ncbi:MAG: MCE family protein [Candidatus Paracaedibacteraceae bacterium]|nr:MCE family protein [Candidatus Paracaedibacteraceae bacterium]